MPQDRDVRHDSERCTAAVVLGYGLHRFHETHLSFLAFIFAGSRAICETDAQWISRVMPEPHELEQSVLDKRLDVLNDLRSLNTAIDPVLESTVLFGVAFHRKFAL